MKVGVWQSNYVPWKGYFDYINDVDIFCFYDEVQYTKNDWRNRNQLLNDTGMFWITIPVGNKYTNYKISEVPIEDKTILAKHFKSIEQCYARAPYKNQILDLLSPYYLNTEWDYLSPFSHALTIAISKYAGIKTEFKDSKDYELKDTRLERLLHLNVQLGATSYLSGPNGRNYLVGNEGIFKEKGVDVVFKDYGPYLKYKRSGLLFDDRVSIIDMLMNVPQEELLKYIISQK